jgi:hypothetical protein
MPINRDLSDLPSSSGYGDPPRAVPRLVTKLAEAWHAQLTDEFAHGAIPELPYRGSDSGKRCDRQLQYSLSKLPDTDPNDIASVWRMNIGTMVHEAIQRIFPAAFDGDGTTVEVERVLDLREIGIPGSQRVDMVLTNAEGVVVPLELKTINGFGFKKMATTFKGPPDGPRSGHRLQLAFSVVALDAPYGVLGYLSLENISPDLLKSMYGPDALAVQQFAAEWVVSRDEAEVLVARERRRIERVLKAVDAEVLVSRELSDPEYPLGATVVNPSTGAWSVLDQGMVVETGRTWMCDYCNQRSRCIQDGPGGSVDVGTEF